MSTHKPPLLHTPALAALMLPLLLAGCGGGDSSTTQKPTQQLTTIDLSANQQFLKLGDSPTLQVVLKDQNGQPMQMPITFSSSQPNVVQVDASGKLSSHRLSVKGKPAIITATAGGKTATLSVDTYGLELAVGTNKYDGDNGIHGLVMAFRLRGNSDFSEPSNRNQTWELLDKDGKIVPQRSTYRLASRALGNDQSVIQGFVFYKNNEAKAVKGDIYTLNYTIEGINYSAKDEIDSEENNMTVPIITKIEDYTDSGSKCIKWHYSISSVYPSQLRALYYKMRASDGIQISTSLDGFGKFLPGLNDYGQNCFQQGYTYSPITLGVAAFSHSVTTDDELILPEQVDAASVYQDIDLP